jgi:hypothetical protein
VYSVTKLGTQISQMAQKPQILSVEIHPIRVNPCPYFKLRLWLCVVGLAGNLGCIFMPMEDSTERVECQLLLFRNLLDS